VLRLNVCQRSNALAYSAKDEFTHKQSCLGSADEAMSVGGFGSNTVGINCIRKSLIFDEIFISLDLAPLTITSFSSLAMRSSWFDSYAFFSIYLSVYLSVCLSICPSVHLSICPNVHLSICPSVHLSEAIFQ
jgi:hypothetical protein